MITVRHESVTDAHRAEVAAAFDARTKAKTDTSAGMLHEADMLDGAHFYRVLEDGVPVAWYVMRERLGPAGREAHISLAHGRAGVDLVREVVPLIERQCAGTCRAITLETRRRGLVKKLEAGGFAVSSLKLRKELA